MDNVKIEMVAIGTLALGWLHWLLAIPAAVFYGFKCYDWIQEKRKQRKGS